MSDNNNSGGRTLGGDPAEPMPSSWARPAATPRVGRIGDWSGSSSTRCRVSYHRSDLVADHNLSVVHPEEAVDLARFRVWEAVPEEVVVKDLHRMMKKMAMMRTRAQRAGLLVVNEGLNSKRNFDSQIKPSHNLSSGINVQNPDRQRSVPGGDMVRDLLRRAAQYVQVCFQNRHYSIFGLSRAGPPPEAPARSSNVFTGGGHTLGSDEVESSYIPGNVEDPEGMISFCPITLPVLIDVIYRGNRHSPFDHLARWIPGRGWGADAV